MAMALVIVLVGTGAGAAYFWSEVERRLTRTDAGVDERLGEAMNILVIGSDSRDGLTDPEDVRRFGRVGGRRADTIILVQAIPAERRVVLVNFPRDLYVPIAGRSGRSRINSAYEHGSATVVETVRNLTGVPVHHYVEVNFLGFRNMVDALGGVEVCLDTPVRDSHLNFRLPEGPVRLDGNGALSFVRSRHSTPDGDFGRIRRQQQFLRAIVSRVGRPSVLLNPVKLRSMATAFADNVTADREFSVGDLLELAPAIRSFGPEQMQSFTVTGDIASVGGQSVVRMHEDRAEKLFGALRELSDPARALDPPPQVIVEDASGRSLAAMVAEQLNARGFEVVAYGPAGEVQAQTEIVAPRRQANEARDLQQLVPDSRLRYAGDELRLLVGSTFDGLVTPPQGSEPQPSGPCDGWEPGG